MLDKHIGGSSPDLGLSNTYNQATSAVNGPGKHTMHIMHKCSFLLL